MQLHSVGPNLVNKSRYNSNISNTNSKPYNAKSKDVSFQASEGIVTASFFVGLIGLAAGVIAFSEMHEKKVKMQKAKQDSIETVERMKREPIERAAKLAKARAVKLEKMKKDSLNKVEDMLFDFEIDNSQIDKSNVEKDVNKQVEARFGKLDKFMANNNENTAVRLAVTKGRPSAYTQGNTITKIYGYDKPPFEMLDSIMHNIKIGKEELSSAMSHDKIVTESGKTISSTVGHSKGIGGGVVGLVPAVGGGSSSSHSNTTTQSQNTFNEFNKVKSDRILYLIESESDNSPIINKLLDSIARNTDYRLTADNFLQDQAKKGRSLAKMKEGLKDLTLKIHPKTYKIPNQLFKKGTKKVSITFFERGRI